MSLPSLGAVAKASLYTIEELYGSRDVFVFNYSVKILQGQLTQIERFLHEKLSSIQVKQYAYLGEIFTRTKLSSMSLKLPLHESGQQYNSQLENVDVMYVKDFQTDVLYFCLSEVLLKQKAQYISPYCIEENVLPRFYGHDETNGVYAFHTVLEQLSKDKKYQHRINTLQTSYQAFWQHSAITRNNLVMSHVKQINETGFKVF
ncbi:hypothetical protein [Fastidiosibacter lacustris]|uniref:hypothetical protein n=1 Tax=Fastidiosibacter lacustris TaxID=2056695 RepID=UPI000E355063|nr:hypothetical protein [Fastidiosibacter lacustris]